MTALLFLLVATATALVPPLPRARRGATALHQVLHPQKGGIVVEAPADGFVARDPLIDALMGRSADGEESPPSSFSDNDDDVILGGNPTFTSRSSGAFAPQTRRSAPTPPRGPPGDLPLFPDLKSMQSSSGPRRISVGESAVFEQRVGKTSGSSAASAAGSGPRAPRVGATSNQAYSSNQGVSIKGDSSIFSSSGFVGGGGSTNVYSGGGSSTSTGPGSRSRATSSSSSSFQTNTRTYNNHRPSVKNPNNSGGANVGNSFRDGTGRDYSSTTSFGTVARNAGRGGVSIKGDASIFSSSGFVGDTTGYDTTGTRPITAVRPPIPTRTTTAPTYTTQHVFDAPSSTTNTGSFSTQGGMDQSYDNMESNHGYDSNPYSSYLPPTSPPPQDHVNSGQSLADNFLTTNNSVRRSGPVPGGDDDYDPDDDMLGYESPTRRGDGFLTEPEPRFVNMPIHTGKWMSELYAEQGLDVFSGGQVGYGAVKGEMQKGGSGGRATTTAAAAAAAAAAGGGAPYGSSNGYGDSNYGYQDTSGYENANYRSTPNNGYANANYRPTPNNGYPNNNGYGGYPNGGNGASFDRFGHTPPGGY